MKDRPIGTSRSKPPAPVWIPIFSSKLVSAADIEIAIFKCHQRQNIEPNPDP